MYVTVLLFSHFNYTIIHTKSDVKLASLFLMINSQHFVQFFYKIFPLNRGELKKSFPTFRRKTYFLVPIKSWRTKFTINTETSDYNQLASLKVFLTNSSTEYLELFTHYFEELSENFNLIIERAETQIKKEIPENIKTKILYNFNINKNQIQNILNKFNHKKRH